MKNAEKFILSMVLKSINQHFDFSVVFCIATLFPFIFLQELPSVLPDGYFLQDFHGRDYFRKSLL